MPRKPSAIPVGTQFSPDLIDLPAFLAALQQHSGDKVAIETAIWSPSVRKKPRAAPPTRRNRSLPVEAAVQYGLLDKQYRVTRLAESLSQLQPPALYEAFARHILLECGGLRVLEGIVQMEYDGLPITGDTLARYLTQHGFPVTEHNTAINSMRLWLEKARIFKKGTWRIDHLRKQTLQGLSDPAIAMLAGFSPEQLAFLEALCRINPSGEYPAASVSKLAAEILGRPLSRASLPNLVLKQLREVALVEYRSGGTASGKSAVLWTLPAFDRDVLEPFVQRTVATLDPALSAYYRMRPADIYADLESSDKGIKGRALEAYAIFMLRLLGLRFVAWRKTGMETGGAEIDVVMKGAMGVTPTVWQIQCKNTLAGSLRLEDVAKEVGLVPLTGATHILILVNGQITPDARQFANDVARTGPTAVFLIDKDGFEEIKKDPANLVSLLREQAEEITALRQGWLAKARIKH